MNERFRETTVRMERQRHRSNTTGATHCRNGVILIEVGQFIADALDCVHQPCLKPPGIQKCQSVYLTTQSIVFINCV